MTSAECKKLIKRVKLLHQTELPATLYELFIITEDKSTGLTEKQLTSIENTSRYLIKKYPHVKVLVVRSTTDSFSARRIKVKTKGRYRTFIMGKKVAPHIHLYAIGNKSGSARKYIHHLADLLRERGLHSRIVSKKHGIEEMNNLQYCYRQADTFHQYGNPTFDFRAYILDE